MNDRISIRIGIGCILLSLILLILSPFYFQLLFDFVRIHISHDHILTQIGVEKISFLLYIIIACIFFFGLFFYFNLGKKLIARIHLQGISDDIKRIFFQDNVCARKNSAKFFFVISSVVAIMIQLSVITFGEPEWEGTIDKYSSSLYLVSVILFLIAIIRLRKLEINSIFKKNIIRRLVMISILCLLMYGEEVSWGQQFFNIDTIGFFKFNYQNENTIHNFFNPLLDYVYALVGISSFLILSYFWLISPSKGMMKNLFLPHISLYIFFLCMTGSIYTGESDELYELHMIIFSLFYAIRLVLCIYYPSKLFIQHKAFVQN